MTKKCILTLLILLQMNFLLAEENGIFLPNDISNNPVTKQQIQTNLPINVPDSINNPVIRQQNNVLIPNPQIQDSPNNPIIKSQNNYNVLIPQLENIPNNQITKPKNAAEFQFPQVENQPQNQDEKVFWISDFTGGLNTYLDSLLIKDSESPDCNNIIFDNKNILESRKGTILKGTVPANGQILSSYEFSQINGVRWYILQCSSMIYATEDFVTYVLVVSSLSTFYPCNFVAYQDKLYIFNGIDNINVWDGVKTNIYTFIPKGKYAIVSDNILYVCGVAGQPSVVFYNDISLSPLDASAWNDLYSVSINEDDGDIITGITLSQGRKIIFKKRGTYKLLGLTIDDFVVRNISNKYGCLDNKSIQEYKNSGIIFLSQDGLRILSGDTVELLSGRIYDEFKNIKQLGGGSLFEWRTSKTGEFDEGTKTNVLSNNNTIYLSSSNYTWDNDSAFQNNTSSVNIQCINNYISLTTITATNEIEVSPVSISGNQRQVGSNAQISNLSYINGISTVASCNIIMSALYSRSGGVDYTITSGNDEVYFNMNMPPSNVTRIDFKYDIGTLSGQGFFRGEYRDIPTNTYKVFPNNYQSGFDRYDNTNLNTVVWRNGGTQLRIGGALLGTKYFYVNDISTSFNINCFTDVVSFRFLTVPQSNLWSGAWFNIYSIKLYGNTNTNVYSSTGIYTSSSFNTGITNPAWGNFDALVSTYINSNVRFWVQTSVDNNTWGSSIAVISGQGLNNFNVPRQQYIRWIAELTSIDGLYSPAIYSVTINSIKPIGTYLSKVYNTRKLNTWSLFITDDVQTTVSSIRL